MIAQRRPFSVYFGLIRKCLTSLIITLFMVLPSLAQDFTARNIGDYGNVTVMEVTGNYDAPDFTSSMVARQVIAKEFFKTHKDEYDFLVVFSNFDYILPEFETLAFYNPVRNDIRGIGHDLFDNTSLYGSSGRLQGTIDMGNIAANVSDPLDPRFDRTLSILAHEFLHRWGSYAKFKDWNGAISSKLIGRDGAHWSFLLDTKGSLEYGNQWKDNGNGTFTSGGTGNKFSPLDLYLMGMIDKSEVPPMLLIENDSVDHTRLPEAGVTISGTPRTVTIDDIIAAEGERFPNAQNSQKQFKMAFIYISTPGSFTGNELNGIENIRNGFLTRFSILTDGKALVQVASTLKEDLPSNPGVRPPTTTPRTLPPNVEEGVRWLTEHQLSDGSWTDFALTTERDTAESVTTLQRFPTALQQFQAGLTWLGSNAPANTDFLARRVEAAAQTGADTAAFVSELLSRRNADGGWGSGKNFLSNPTDTALALKALSRAGYADQQVIDKTIGWLTSVQNGDGGWSGSDGISTIQPTSAVLSVLNSYRKSFSLDASIAGTIAFLATKQNADGGFGNSPSTVYDSAVAVMALQEAGADKETIGKGVAYLNSLQTGGGSWQDSPYQTALAVRAIWQASVDPDLSIKDDDLTFIPATITTLPTTAVLNAVISNLGRNDVPQAKVAVYDGVVAPEKKVAEQIVAFPGQGPVTLTFAIPITDGDGHLFHVVVDAENLVKESDEYNNSAVKVLYPQPTHDFVVTPDAVTVTPNPVDNGQQVTVKAVIANKGTSDAFNVPVRFYVDDAAAPIDIATVNVDIPAGGSVTKEVVWQASRAGTDMSLTVMADPAGAFTENDEANNKAVIPLTVNAVVFTDPNLSVSYKEIVVTPNPVSQNGSVTISAVVRNDGYADAPAVAADFYKGVPGVDGVLLGTRNIDLLKQGESATVTIPWTDIAEAGEKVIYVKIDPANVIKEMTEADNAAFVKLTVQSHANLAVYSSSITFTPHAPKEGEPVSVAVTVFNKGDLPASNITVQALDGTASLGTQGITSIAGNSHAIVFFPLDTTGKVGIHQITASVAADASTVEQNIANNSAVATLIVYKADLMLSEPYFSPNGDGIKDTTRFSFRLEAPQTVTVDVVNKKGETVSIFSGADLANVISGSVVWDGMDMSGKVVADGAYRFVAKTAAGVVISEVAVVVDNDRTSLVDSLLAGSVVASDLTCKMPPNVLHLMNGYTEYEFVYFRQNHVWLSDGSGAIFSNEYDPYTMDVYPWTYSPGKSDRVGIYKVSTDGSTIDKLTPKDWLVPVGRTISAFSPSPDGKKIVMVATTHDRTYYRNDQSNEIWVMNIDGSNLKLLDTLNNPDNPYGNVYAARAQIVGDSETNKIVPRWSPDNKTVAYAVQRWNGSSSWIEGWQCTDKMQEIVSVDTETGTKKTLISLPLEGGWTSFKWSPDGNKMLATTYRCTYTGWSGTCYSSIAALRVIDTTTLTAIYGQFDQLTRPTWINDSRIVGTKGSYFVVINAADATIVSSQPAQGFVLSPDKKRVALQTAEVPIYDDNLNLIAKASGCGSGSEHQFSPDGKKLACKTPSSGVKIGVVDIDSGNTTNISFLKEDDYFFNSYYALKWLGDSEHLVLGGANSSGNFLYVYDVNSGVGQRVSSGFLNYGADRAGEPGFPTYNNVLVFGDGKFDTSPNCTPKQSDTDDNFSLWTMSSGSNLTAELVPVRQNSQVLLTGTAADLNLEGYKIEYATLEAPDVWYPVIPFAEAPVQNGTFGGWVPPAEGSYFVRLTVWDKAGNVAFDRKKVPWGKFSSITDLYKSDEVISPNGDGFRDAVQLTYRVMEPLHVDIVVYDQDNAAVKSFIRDYAALSVDSISWDGKNESGAVVPDGTYRIHIADYDFFVKVDNRAPETALALSPIVRSADSSSFNVTLSGHTFDSNIKEWNVEYGEGDNPQHWYAYKNGAGLLGARDGSNNVIIPVTSTAIESYGNQQIGWLAGKKFRITAEDYAGKKTSAVTGFVEEKIAIYLWGGNFVVGDVLSPGQSKPGLQGIEAVETVRTPLLNTVLQYLNGSQWVDAETIAASEAGTLQATWDNSALNLPKDYQVRIKATDSAGREFYSNTLQASQPNNQFKIWSLCSDDSSTLSLLAENPYDSLSRLSFQIKSSQDARYPDWTDFGAYDRANGDSIPTESINVPRPDIKPGTTYQIRMLATAANGASYTSNIVTHPSACAVELALEVKNTEADCGSAPGASNIMAQIKKLNAGSVAQTLSYYLQKPAGAQLLRKFDLAHEPWAGTVLETAGLAEGNYQVRAVVTFLDPSVGVVKAAEVSGNILVDHAAPISSITYPTSSLQLCASSMKTSIGNWFGIPVEGIVGDETKVKHFELLYGVGGNPAGWLPAKSRSGGTPADIKGTSPVNGEIGIFDVTDVRNSDISLKLKVVDSAGNASCSTTSFRIKPVPEVRNLAVSASMISPNGDGVSDSAVASYSIDGSASLEVKVFPLNISTDGSLVLGTTPVRTILPSHYFSGGNGKTEWDGKSDGGAVVPDGLYAIAVSAVDGCSNSSFKWVAVEVDKTPPTSLITYPRGGDAMGVVAEVRGTADDPHFRSYMLEAGEGDDPSSWLPVATGAAQVKDGVLGKWNTFGRQGRWTLRLSVEDASGNKSKTTVALDLAARQTVIKAADASPKAFSPNLDGKLETTVISYEVTDASQVKIELVNAAGAVVRDYMTTTASAGTFNFVWDGKGNTGTSAGDGTYGARITAALVANPAVSQVETVTVSVDTTQPRLEVAQPLDNSFMNKVQIPVIGTVDDPNVASYNVTVSGPQGALSLDSGSQARSAYTFGTFNEAAEGNYVLTVEAKDSAGNSAVINRSFTVDKTAPAPSLTTPKNDEFYGSKGSPISISGSIEEKNLERYALRYGYGVNPYYWTELASGTTPPAAGQLYSWKVGPGDGVSDSVYTLSLWAKDKAGTEKEARVKLTVDNTKPAVSIYSPTNGTYIKAPFSMYGAITDNSFDKGALEMSEGSCAAAYKWSTVKTFSSVFSYNVLETWDKIPADGEYCLKLSAVDKVGNEAQATVSIKVDTVPPTAPVVKGALENLTEAALQWTASPEVDVAGYNLYRGTQKLNASLLSQLNYRDLNLKEGAYSYTVKAVDFAGNESGPSNTVKVVIDTTPPAARITVPSDGARVGGEVEIRGMADSPDDFKQYRVYLGSGANPIGWNLIRTSPAPTANGLLAQWDTLSAPEGVYSIKLEAEDLSGNVNTQRVAVTVDNTQPAKPQILSAVASGSNVTITWNGAIDADVAGFLLYKNDKVTNSATTPGGSLKGFLVPGPSYVDQTVPDGKYVYYVIAMDQSGNLSDQSNSVTVNVDARAPHAVITQPAGWVKFSDPIVLQSSCTDLDVAKVQYQYKKSTDSSWSNIGSALTAAPYTASFDPKGLGLPYALYQIRPVATDLAGHTDNAPEYREVTYDDTVPPVAPTNFKATGFGDKITLTWDANAEQDLKGYILRKYDGSYWSSSLTYDPLTTTTYVNNNLDESRYVYELQAVDKSNNYSTAAKSEYITIYKPVLAQPYTPTGLAAIPLEGKAALPSSVVELTNVTASGTAAPVMVTADASGNFRVDQFALAPGENRISARGIDAAGNVSKPSDQIVVAYNGPPAAPTGLVPVVQGYDVSLAWNANVESDLAGYNLYRDGRKVNAPDAVTQATAQASSMYEYYNWYSSPYYVVYKPSNALDGLPDTYWASYGYSSTFYTQWWEADLPAKQLVNGIEINWGVQVDSQGAEVLYGGKDFEVQAWSGTAWMTIAKVQGNAAKTSRLEFTPSYGTDKIRISVSATNDPYNKQVRIAEVKLLKENPITAASYLDASLKDGKYVYSVTAVDNYGLESERSAEAAATVGDVIPPGQPTALVATASGSSVSLAWLTVGDADLAGYNVYRTAGDAWVKMNASAVAGAAYIENNVKNGSYRYRVTAVDAVGNESTPSDEAAGTVFTTLPPTPQNLKVQPVPQGEAMVITWDAVGGSAVSYNLFRSVTSGTGYVKIKTLQLSDNSYTDTGLTNGSTYYYTVASADALGNESDRAAEVAGTAVDTVPPSIPVLAFPGTAGSRIVTYDGTTAIAGTADPGATVELLKNGVPAGTTTPVDTIDAFKLSFDTGGITPTVSPLGDSVAYSNGSIVLQGLSGATTLVANYAYSPEWNAVGTKLAFRSRNSYWRYKLAFYDIDSGSTEVINTDPTSNDSNMSWSKDGKKILYSNDRTGYNDLYLRDMETGGVTKLTSWIYPYNPKLSPDGNLAAYFEYNILKIVNGSTLATEQVDTYGVYSSKLDWSPDSTKLAFVSTRNNYQNLYSYDTVTKAVTPLTKTTNTMPGPLAWSPDGSKVAYIRSESDGTNGLWLADLSGNNKVVQQKLPSISELRWKNDGELLYITGSAVNTVFLGKHFVFKGVSLDPGENVFYTLARDAAGNASDSSDEVRVSYDARKVPDVSIASEDIYIYPPFPKPGEQMSVNVLVRNNNKTETQQSVDVEVYAWDGSGELMLLKTQTLNLPPNYAEEISADLNAGFVPGAHSIIVVVDSGNKIKESDEGNNYASAEFYVTDKEELLVSALLDGTEYKASTEAALTVTVGNSGSPKNGSLSVNIEDADGNPSASLETTALYVPYGTGEPRSYRWNTGASLAGSYKAHAVFTASDGTVAESVVPFAIVPDIALQTSLATDKERYGANELVNLAFSIKNGGSNNIITEAGATIKVLDQASTLVFAEVKNLGNLFPNSSVNLSTTWNTGIASPGNYLVTLEVSAAGGASSSSSQAFTINQTSRITGTVSVDPAVVPAGGGFRAAYTVSNAGNAAADGTVRAVVVDPDSGAVVLSAEGAAVLPAGVAKSGEFSFSSSGLQTKPYQVRLRYVAEGKESDIYSAGIKVQDVMPPVVTALSPQPGTTYTEKISFTAQASDDGSGISVVEYQLDGLGWQVLPLSDPATGRYAVTWSPTRADSGVHTVSFRATDRANNATAPVSTTFSFEYGTDYLPPVLWLSTLSDGSFTADQTLNIAGTVWDDTAVQALQVNGVDVPINEDGSFSYAFPLEAGSNLVTTVATDEAGNRTMDQRTINLQLANLTVFTPADNSKTAQSSSRVSGSTDPASTVTVAVAGVSQLAARDEETFTADVTLQPGLNTILITATAPDGFATTAKRTVLYDDQMPSLAVTEPNQDIWTNQGSLMIKGTASDPWTAVGVTVDVDGQTLTPLLVNGSFEQLVTLTEEKPYVISVTATNEVGTHVTVQRNIIHDTTAPVLMIDPLPSQTNLTSLAVSGMREEGAEVSVVCSTALVGEIAYPTSTTWSTTLSGMQLGPNTLTATSSDVAGNLATTSATINHVEKAPDITLTATPALIWPPDRKLVPVHLGGEVVPHGSDLRSVSISVADEYGEFVYSNLTFGDTIMLEAWREGNDLDGRAYTITAVATDSAGNTTTKATVVRVFHDASK